MRDTFLIILGVMFLMVAYALAQPSQPLTKFLPGDAATVSSHTVTLIFGANYMDKNRLMYSATYNLAVASTTTGVSCTSNFVLPKDIFLSFPKNATYAVYGLSCGVGDTTVFKMKDY